MKIYTDYYGNYKHWAPGAVPISISRFPPAGYKGKECKIVAPEEWLLEAMKTGNASQEFYIKAYKKQLDSLGGPNVIMGVLSEISEGKDIILVCYEKDGDFCHRHLLKKYLESGGLQEEGQRE